MLHIKKIKPLFTSVVTTGDRFEKDMKKGGVTLACKGDLKLWQEVLFVGGSVREVKPGDKVMVNADNYAVKRYDGNSIQNDLGNNRTVEYAFRWVTLDNEDGTQQECLLLQDRDILYAFDGEERDDTIEVPQKRVIV